MTKGKRRGLHPVRAYSSNSDHAPGGKGAGTPGAKQGTGSCPMSDGIPYDKSKSNDTCRCCEREAQKSGKPFDKLSVVGHWEHELICPHVQGGKSLCHSRWLPFKDQFPKVKFMSTSAGKRTEDRQGIRGVKKKVVKGVKKSGPQRVLMVGNIGNGSEEPGFRPSPSVLRAVEPDPPILITSFPDYITEDADSLRQCRSLMVQGFHQTISYFIQDPIDQSLKAVIPAWQTGALPKAQCMVCWGTDIETGKGAQGILLSLDMEMEGPGYVSRCVYCLKEYGLECVDSVAASDIWRHLRHFQRKLEGEDSQTLEGIAPVQQNTGRLQALRTQFRLKGEDREARQALESITLSSGTGSRIAQVATEETPETDAAWHMVEEEVNLEYIMNKLPHVRLMSKLYPNFIETDVGKAMFQLSCGY